jgi:hypothetical protein
MREQTIGNLGKHEVARKRQKDSKTKGLEGVLAADDRRPENP